MQNRITGRISVPFGLLWVDCNKNRSFDELRTVLHPVSKKKPSDGNRREQLKNTSLYLVASLERTSFGCAQDYLNAAMH
jgi:hypothetical protein